MKIVSINSLFLTLKKSYLPNNGSTPGKQEGKSTNKEGLISLLRYVGFLNYAYSSLASCYESFYYRVHQLHRKFYLSCSYTDSFTPSIYCLLNLRLLNLNN